MWLYYFTLSQRNDSDIWIVQRKKKRPSWVKIKLTAWSLRKMKKEGFLLFPRKNPRRVILVKKAANNRQKKKTTNLLYACVCTHTIYIYIYIYIYGISFHLLAFLDLRQTSEILHLTVEDISLMKILFFYSFFLSRDTSKTTSWGLLGNTQA